MSAALIEQAAQYFALCKGKVVALIVFTAIVGMALSVALHVPDDELAPYLELGWKDPPFTRSKGYGYTPHFTPRAAYAAMITRMDRYVGNVLRLLDELGSTTATARPEESFEMTELLARLLQHVPEPRLHQVRYYGEPGAAERRRLRRSWAQLVRRIYEVDPLVCSECGGEMRIIAFLLDPAVVRKILDLSATASVRHDGVDGCWWRHREAERHPGALRPHDRRGRVRAGRRLGPAAAALPSVSRLPAHRDRCAGSPRGGPRRPLSVT